MKSVNEAFEGAITEIRAGEVLIPKSEADKAWNDASERAISICGNYQRGRGLFQQGQAKDESC